MTTPNNVKESVSTNNVKLDNVWTLLEWAKRKEEESKDSVLIRECSIHPAVFVFLENDQQLGELVQFCTNPRSFCVLGVGPTFNIFDRNTSLTASAKGLADIFEICALHKNGKT